MEAISIFHLNTYVFIHLSFLPTMNGCSALKEHSGKSLTLQELTDHFDESRARFIGYLARRGVDYNTAEDVIQEAFLNLYGQIERKIPVYPNLIPLSLRQTGWRLLKKTKGRYFNRPDHFGLDDLFEHPPDSVDHFSDVDNRDLVEVIFNGFSVNEEHLQITSLHLVDGVDRNKIAQMYRCSLSNVKNILHRTMERLKIRAREKCPEFC